MALSTARQRRLARKSGNTISPQLPTGTPNDTSLPGEAGALPPSSIPHQVVTDAPGADVTREMASGGEKVVRGDSDLQPLNAKGRQTVAKVGAKLAGGGPYDIQPAGSQRAVDTAQAVSQQTGSPVDPPDARLNSHAMGQLEGEPKTPEVKRYLAKMVKESPDTRIPGQGAMSDKPGESTRQFEQRGIQAFQALQMRLAQNPTKQIIVPTSTQVFRLAEAWCAAGCPDDMSIDPNVYLKEKAEKPGDIERFFPEPDGKWKMTPTSPEKVRDGLPGIFFMRHGETDSVQEMKASAGQKARAQLVAHVRSGKWQEAHKAAKAAIGSGALSEDDASDAIDSALPGAQEAAGMPLEDLLTAASAAGPQKKGELMPVLQQRLGPLMQQASPEAQHAINSHLGRIR